jgi:hypothetical protein
VQIFSDELHYVAKDRYRSMKHWLVTPSAQLRKEREEQRERDVMVKKIGALLRETFQGRSF